MTMPDRDGHKMMVTKFTLRVTIYGPHSSATGDGPYINLFCTCNYSERDKSLSSLKQV